MRGAWLTVGLAVMCVVVAGCVKITGGTAKPADAAGPSTSSTATSSPRNGLAGILLDVADVNSVMHATDMEVMNSGDDMVDNSDGISDPDCLGALYSAQKTVYAGTGWTDVQDQVLQEPEDNNNHWVEQTAVQLPSPDRALDFLNASLNKWQGCLGKSISEQDAEYRWSFGGLTIQGKTISQTMTQDSSGGWACQHALSAVSDVIVEAIACSESIGDEAVTLADKMADNVQ